MAKYTSAEARKEFAEIVNRTVYAKERIVITRKGKNVVAIVPIEDLELLEEIENRIDLEDAREALKRNEFIPWETVKKERRG